MLYIIWIKDKKTDRYHSFGFDCRDDFERFCDMLDFAGVPFTTTKERIPQD